MVNINCVPTLFDLQLPSFFPERFMGWLCFRIFFGTYWVSWALLEQPLSFLTLCLRLIFCPSRTGSGLWRCFVGLPLLLANTTHSSSSSYLTAATVPPSASCTHLSPTRPILGAPLSFPHSISHLCSWLLSLGFTFLLLPKADTESKI